ncbi:ABC transporter substrate-binding protein [Janibacter terrae]|uniref:ABC transporter substrate-binding protein n=1 Tax=Janibacter terrae TaxID=103817 RepID=A0ABZ2FFP2_9MICO|nr:ABC transporter substrate-binding protein [Janibacter terrae]MBA4084282.1 branched-chain amino acid ABC transporter substrate-binding protein [Kytococcus sp.]
MKSKALRRTRVVVPLTVAAITLITACGDGGSSTSSSSVDSQAASEALGAENKASGDPIKIGYVETGQTAAIDTTNEDKTAAAVLKYANDHLGGVGGRPAELVVCETKGTPAGAQECGSKFVREDVVAVVSSSVGEPGPLIKQLNSAKIPFTANLAANEAALKGDDVFIFGNPLSVFATPAQFGKEKGATNAALVVIDVPGSAGPAKTLAPLLFGNAGAKTDPVLIAPGTADMTPQIQAALNKKPDIWYVLGDPNFCSSAAKAFQTLNVTENVLMDGRCIGEDAASALPGIDKMKFVTGFTTDPTDKDHILLRAILDKYADGLESDVYAATAFQGTLSLISGINAGKPAEVTAESVTKALREAPATNYPLSAGTTFQCDGKQVPKAISPNICSTGGLIASADADGTLKDFKAVDAKDLYVMPKK